jgi:hypothetical protein
VKSRFHLFSLLWIVTADCDYDLLRRFQSPKRTIKFGELTFNIGFKNYNTDSYCNEPSKMNNGLSHQTTDWDYILLKSIAVQYVLYFPKGILIQISLKILFLQQSYFKTSFNTQSLTSDHRMYYEKITNGFNRKLL